MATTKVVTVHFNNVTLTAGAGDQTSATQDLLDGYGGCAFIRLTNGATGPTVAAQVQIQTDPTTPAGYDYGGALVGSTANNAVREWVIDIPIGVSYIAFVAGGNTDQNVTCRAEVTEVTAV